MSVRRTSSWRPATTGEAGPPTTTKRLATANAAAARDAAGCGRGGRRLARSMAPVAVAKRAASGVRRREIRRRRGERAADDEERPRRRRWITPRAGPARGSVRRSRAPRPARTRAGGGVVAGRDGAHDERRDHAASRPGPKPRVVVAGVPTRMPEAVLGGSWSKGMAFLLTVMPTSSRQRLGLLAGDPEGRHVDQHEVVVGAARDEPGTLAS